MESSSNSGAHPSTQERPEAEEGDRYRAPEELLEGTRHSTCPFHSQISCCIQPPHSFRQILLFLSQEVKEHGYRDLQNQYNLPWGWNTGIVVHSPEQLQQTQQSFEWIWLLNHMQIMWTSASPCKRTSCTDLIFKLTNIFRSTLPSWKHVLLISYYAVQIQTVVAPISSPNQYKRSFSKTTTAKLTCSSQFSIQLHYWSQHNRKQRRSMKIQSPTEAAALGPQGIPEGQSPMDIPAHRAPFLTLLPTGKYPPLLTP